MKRTSVALAAIAAFAAIGALTVLKPGLSPLRLIKAVGAQATGTAIYYRHPDGLPSYSLTPKITPERGAWYTRPVVLGVIMLVAVIVLDVIFR